MRFQTLVAGSFEAEPVAEEKEEDGQATLTPAATDARASRSRSIRSGWCAICFDRLKR